MLWRSFNGTELRWLQHACFATLLLFWLSHKALNLFPPCRPRRTLLARCALSSGDILLFSYSQLQDDVARFMYNSPFTHVGLVYRNLDGGIFVWESVRQGARLVPLATLLARRYRPGEGLVFRKMQGPPVDHARFTRFIRARLGQPYSHDYWKALYNRWFPHMPLPIQQRLAHSGTPRFCTDIVAETLEHLGVLDYSQSYGTYASTLPLDFSQAKEWLPYAPHYTYGEEVLLVQQ